MALNKEDLILNLILDGHTAPEICKYLSLPAYSYVYKVAYKHNLKVKKPCADRHNEMRKFKAEGHTNKEVAEKFHVSHETARKVCVGICPQPGVAANKGVLQDINNVKCIINERASGFEYAGNYTGSSGSVDLRCKKCGHVHTHSWWGVRHNGVKVCPNCLEIEKQKREADAKSLLEANKMRKELQKECDMRGKQVVHLLTRFLRLHRCPVCGTLTDNKKYCSTRCYRKANEAAKDANRRKKIKNALIDKDINLERLYDRDNGVCAICGDKCDWSDHQYRGRTFIVGAKYPSIDHIVPLSKGGVHSWNNVQLAHFSCNSAKGASLCG